MKGNHTPRHIDMTGQRFGRLLVLSYDYTDENSRMAMWKVRCDCGVEFVTYRNALISGDTRSCGCLRAELLRERRTKTK